jgi:proteic killer suppression protein
MLIEFEKDYLEQLYADGKATNKKYRFQPSVVKQYKNTIDKLRSAQRIEDLYSIKSLHYEKKSGDLEGIEAVWVNKQYRIEFSSRREGEDPGIITICSILDLSHHYKKR